MSVVRRFLVAPALARLVRKERGSARVTEGFFPPQAGRTSFVRIEGAQCHLVLMTTDAGGVAAEERTEVPRAHGDALLDVCGGKVAYERSTLSMGQREALIDRYTAPGTLEIVSVAFDSAEEAQGFPTPIWFGPEVTADAAYEARALALEGLPATAETALSNAALDAVLDLFEHRFSYRYGAQPGRGAAEDAGVMSALRRLAGNVGAPAAQPAEPAARAEAPVIPPPPAPLPPLPPAEPEPAPAADARIDDVMEGLSQALGAAVQETPRPEPSEPDAARQDTARQDTARPEKPRAEGETPSFERWSVRPRRAQT